MRLEEEKKNKIWGSLHGSIIEYPNKKDLFKDKKAQMDEEEKGSNEGRRRSDMKI